ncbi:hypothetical protein CAPTEDRAFT_219703 [Capitella teleta]|uniref:Uncharacterized protein n=1 Tax=Capitella teleta TaxID=283909 RepID=R7U586_CAPTE|nr:hypothetical protein CAPTEDRAFT_219703 [Capitella teleta]|eukprot:ELU01139.1 hypothetical protein CAPTEDRAFT_219703 [Capitella teleta]
MASGCLGNPGIHRSIVSASRDCGKITDGKNYEEVVWVKKRYVPDDLRTVVPAPRYKLLVPAPNTLQRPEPQWIKSKDPVPQAFQPAIRGPNAFISQPSTRCEEWSTLSQILPSVGNPIHRKPPNWGTGPSLAPLMTSRVGNRFPHINSPMTSIFNTLFTQQYSTSISTNSSCSSE